MKYVIASDLHGSATYTEKLLSAYRKHGADRLVLLGDILYHGPRNDLPEGYAPKKVIELLNNIKNEILCIRGNCEAPVDQMVLSFPCLADYAVLEAGDKTLYLTHGDVYNMENPLPMPEGSICISGHTHIPLNAEKDGRRFLNPGSVSIPKSNTPHSYIFFDGESFFWYTLDGECYDKL